MILYFSGTGNSAYVANRVGKATGDEAVNLFEKIRNRDFSDVHTERPWSSSPPPTRGGSRVSWRIGWSARPSQGTGTYILS